MNESPQKPRALRELIRRRTKELVAEAQSADGVVDGEQLSVLERLSRLHEMDTFLDEPRRYRVWSSIALVAALVTVVLLYEIRPRSTAVSAEMLVRELAMEVGKDQAVIPGSGLSYLSITGLDSARLPSGDDQFETVQANTVGLLVDTSAVERGTLDLDEWLVPAGTGVRVLATDVNGTYGWSVDYPERSEQMQITATRVLIPIPVASTLAFDQRLRYQEQYRELSSVLGGNVTLEDLASREIKFGPGQSLRFTHSDVEIPHLALERSGIRIRFSGEVGGMSTGAARHRNLMPRMLQLLATSPALLLIGSAVLTVFGYLLGFRRWLSQTK
jgi:hypothetical protein